MHPVLLHFEDEVDLASRIAAAAGLRTAYVRRHRFPDGELKLRLPGQLPPRVALLRSWRSCWLRAPRGPWAQLR
jgi:ribose-phosphate pyrophosphokinase